MDEAFEMLVFAEVQDRSVGMRQFEQFCRNKKCQLPRWFQAGVWHPDMQRVVFAIACLGLEKIRHEGLMWHLSLSASKLPVPIHTGDCPVPERWLARAARQVLPGITLEIDREESHPLCIHAFGRPAPHANR